MKIKIDGMFMRKRCFFLSISLLLMILPGMLYASDRKDDGWTLTATDAEERYYGVPIANGSMGLMPGKDPFSVKGVILNNVYDANKNHGVSRIANAVNPWILRMSINGTPVSRETMHGWSQTLDLRHARLDASWKDRDAEISYTLRALRNMPHVAVMTVEIKALKDITVSARASASTPKGFTQADSSRISYEAHGCRYGIPRTWASTPNRGILMSASSCLVTDDGPVDGDISLKKGKSLKMHLIGSVCTAQDFDDPCNESDREVLYCIMEGMDTLIARHEAQWDELWQGDIIIDGDTQAQKVARAALYSLYSSCREDSDSSIPPFGTSSREYNGHIFWDSELWMYPPMLFLNQGIAASMTDYRLRRLDAARRKAAAYGYKGAMFPWESDWSGEEACPVSAPTGLFEHHISADVAIATWNRWCMTHDTEWLRDQAWPLLRDVADFWVSRARRNADGSWSIRNVVCADEFAEGADDNAFTNGAARKALMTAVKAAAVCGHTPSPMWQTVADGLRILRNADGVTLEYDGYDGRIIKQADVNLLSYPLQVITDEETVRKDLLYYEDRILPKGPAMSYAILALQWARLGDGQKAYELYLKTLEGHLHGGLMAFSETAGQGDTCFMTGWGGVLQTFINGFCGLELTDGGVVQKQSALPDGWKSVTVTGVGPERKTFTRVR